MSEAATSARSAGRQRPLAVTMGDPAGIGVEITLKAWRDRRELDIPPFVFFADPDVVAATALQLGIDVPIRIVNDLSQGPEAFQSSLPLRPVACAFEVKPGLADPRNGAAVISAIEMASDAALDGSVAAIVTNPIAKHVLYDAGFAYPGHTEFLGALATRRYPAAQYRPVMMLASDELRVVPLTVHMPLSEVPGRITSNLIVETATAVALALRTDFGIATPRVAIAGLNPHAGESGAIGREEVEIIAPAIVELMAQGLAVTGPHSADTLFHAEARARYDVVIAMYHDQALIPLKTLAFDSGVNVTIGLPFIRTSPDHGTAFDIAGRGIASAASLIASLELAARMAARRRRSGE